MGRTRLRTMSQILEGSRDVVTLREYAAAYAGR